MSDFQIPLNGSNYVSQKRKQAFKNAINDNYVIDCKQPPVLDPEIENEGNNVPGRENIEEEQTMTMNDSTKNNGQYIPLEIGRSIEKGLDHSIAHQNRTIEIHQQFLDQQKEYAKLINSVLNQQGKVLDNGAAESNQEIIDTFQHSLESFHQVREKDLEVHQQFLAQQADFSHSFVRVLEKQHALSTNGNGHHVVRVQPESNTPTSADSVADLVHDTDPEPILDTKVSRSEIVIEEKEPITTKVVEEGISLEMLTAALLRIVGDKTGYPSEMLEAEMDLEADLGIDSIKRVEILGALEEEFPSLPPADTEILAQTRTLAEIVDYLNAEQGSPSPGGSIQDKPEVQQVEAQPTTDIEESPAPETTAPQTGISIEDLTTTLLEIVSEKTGYPAEMLESNMDMEADLGIDSIKRVEILGAMEERIPGLPAVEAEVLSELRTLGEIVEMMNSNQESPESSVQKEDTNKKKVKHSTLDTTPVELVSLPEPDFLDFPISRDHPLLVTDEGSEFTHKFTDLLTKNGWKVIVWNFPEVDLTRDNRELSQDVVQVFLKDSSQESIQTTLNEIKETHGSISGFVHLHPGPDKQVDFVKSDRDLVKGVFFLAGALKSDLSETQSSNRLLFLTVTRLDGQLGFNPTAAFQEAGGLTGVVKTLHWEWPDVFCRAIDLDPTDELDTQIEWVIQEIHDPDQGLLEVGRSKNQRVTIERVYQD